MRSVPVLLAFTDGDAWHPSIGDPTLMGWVTVVAYFAVAAVCLRRMQFSRRSHAAQGQVIFWGVLGALLIFLGINKQLDLQTLVTLTGRRIAIAQGWYESRRAVQLIFVLLIALGGLAGFALMWRLVRAHGRELWLSLLGFVLLLGFVIVRAASFHHFDSLINLNLGGIKMNWVLELGAIALIALGARRRGVALHAGGSRPGKRVLAV